MCARTSTCLACAACTAYDYALAAAATASAGAWVAFAICGSLAMLGTLIFPSLSALMSQAADEKEQGNIQGALHAAFSEQHWCVYLRHHCTLPIVLAGGFPELFRLLQPAP